MKYYIIAGEASGDLHGSNLMKAILRNDPQAEIRFWGGDLMQSVGGTLVKHIRDLAFTQRHSHTHMHAYTETHSHTQTHTRRHIHTHVHTHIDIHTQTQTQTQTHPGIKQCLES